jgi:hypothetical protein
MAALQFYLQLGKQKNRVVGDNSHVGFGKKIHWWKGKCGMV